MCVDLMQVCCVRLSLFIRCKRNRRFLVGAAAGCLDGRNSSKSTGLERSVEGAGRTGYVLHFSYLTGHWTLWE